MFGNLPLNFFQGPFCVRYTQIHHEFWLGLANLLVEPIAEGLWSEVLDVRNNLPSLCCPMTDVLLVPRCSPLHLVSLSLTVLITRSDCVITSEGTVVHEPSAQVQVPSSLHLPCHSAGCKDRAILSQCVSVCSGAGSAGFWARASE